MDVWMACEKDTNIISGNGILKIVISNTLLFKNVLWQDLLCFSFLNDKVMIKLFCLANIP